MNDDVTAQLAGLVRAKRRKANLTLRAAAHSSGISASTLSRLERGVAVSLPDAETIRKLARWLERPVGSLLGSTHTQRESQTSPEPELPDLVEVHLRADKTLKPDTADALARMFRSLYTHAAEVAPEHNRRRKQNRGGVKNRGKKRLRQLG